MKITKTQLSQIVQEELANAMSESEQWQMGRSRKASDMYQLGRDDYGAFSAEEPTDDGVELDGERYPDDENYVKGWRDQQEEDAQDVEDDSWQRDPAHDYEDDSYEEVEDDDWMWENKITKSKLAQIVQEELKATLSEDLAPYGNLKGYVLQALRDLGGEQPVSDIAAEVMEPWAEDNWSAEDGRIDEEGMFYSVDAALESLQVDGRVRLTQGGPGSTNEDFYTLAQ